MTAARFRVFTLAITPCVEGRRGGSPLNARKSPAWPGFFPDLSMRAAWAARFFHIPDIKLLSNAAASSSLTKYTPGTMNSPVLP